MAAGLVVVLAPVLVPESVVGLALTWAAIQKRVELQKRAVAVVSLQAKHPGVVAASDPASVQVLAPVLAPVWVQGSKMARVSTLGLVWAWALVL